MKKWILLAGLLCGLVSPLFAYQGNDVRPSLLGVDDRAYPQVDIYFSLTDSESLTPIRGLTAADVSLSLSSGEALTVNTLSEERRPLHIVVVLDVTGSVDEEERAAQQAAIRAVLNRLRPDDQLALVLLNDSARVAVPLTDDRAVFTSALEAASIQPDTAGNAYWDAVYTAADLLVSPAGVARQAVLILTDTAPGGGEGVRSAAETTRLLTERGIQAFGLYFEFEDDGIPENPPLLPPELTDLSAQTGGVALGGSGAGDEEGYSDEAALPLLAEDVAELLNAEYRLTLTSPLPQDGERKGFSLTLTYQGGSLPTLSGVFVAGQRPIRITFPGLAEGQTVSLPLTLTLDIQTTQATLNTVNAVLIDSAGAETPLTLINNVATLERGSLPPGAYRLRVTASDSAGNTDEASLTLTIQERLAVAWREDPPARLTSGEEIVLRAAVAVPESVREVRLLINGEVESIADVPPFDEVSFEWRADEPGDYSLEIVAVDVEGNTASQIASLTVEAGSGVGNNPMTFALIGALIVGFFLVIGGGVIGWRVWTSRQESAAALPPTPEGAQGSDAEGVAPSPLPTQAAIPSGDGTAYLQAANGLRFKLMPGMNTIGRQSDNTIQLKDESVSRRHALIEITGRRAFYSDLPDASHPGEINGLLVEAGARVALKDGDRLRVGSTVLTFRRE